MNPNAKSFVPRVSAAPFVPGQPSHAVPADNNHIPPPHTSNPAAQTATPEASSVMNGQAEAEEVSSSSAAPPPAASKPPPTPAADSWDDAAGAGGGDAAAGDGDGNNDVDEDGVEDEEEEDEEEEVKKETKKKSKPAGASSVIGRDKQPVNVVFIGHVDAGKSTIGGQIMKLTGMVDERTLQKYEREAKEKNRESWYLSWCMDTNLEERDKGKTVEVGRAYFETEKKHFTILDAPGHKSFVPNMIGGASQADLAVLVISARKGEFETGFDRGGQTREHAMLVKTAGVRHLVVLVNKMDDHTVNWSEDRWNEIQSGLTPYLRKVGFNPKTDVKFIPCSGLTGAFLKELPKDNVCPWYSGPCFIEYIDSMPEIDRNVDGPVRVILVDKYNDMGAIVLGKVESGSVQKGANLMLMPNRVTVQVLQIWTDDVEAEGCVSGENVKFKLKGIDEADVLGGFILCSSDSLCKVGKTFDAQVVILEPPAASIICPGYTAVLHIHAAVEEATVKNIICYIDRKTNEKQRPPGGCKFVKQDQAAIIRFETNESFCLEAFKEFPQMGRFTLRDEGRTIAVGKVLKVID